MTLGANSSLAKAGTVNIAFTSATAGTATLTLSDGTQSTLAATVADGTPKTVTFTSTALTNGTGSFVVSSDQSFANGHVLSFQVGRTFTPVPAMAANDVIITGVTIGVSYAASDNGKSPAGSAAASAIARAATINQNLAQTKVAAIVNTNVMTGSAMGTGLDSKSGTVTINGFTSAPITTVLNNTRESLAA